MRLFSFLLFYKAFVTLVSSCSPEIKDGNFISTSLSVSSNWRFNIQFYVPFPGSFIITHNGDRPADNEIFMLKQPSIGVYEFRPFISFDQDLTIEIPAVSINNGDIPLIINRSIDGNNQKFSIICDDCNLSTNSANWVKYHTSCLIKNVASNLCMSGKDLKTNVTQTDCATASKWDLFGKISPYVSSPMTTSSDSPTIANSTSGNSKGVISVNELVAAVLGSIIGTALISFMAGYWVIKRKQLSKNELFPHAINN